MLYTHCGDALPNHVINTTTTPTRTDPVVFLLACLLAKALCKEALHLVNVPRKHCPHLGHGTPCWLATGSPPWARPTCPGRWCCRLRVGTKMTGAAVPAIEAFLTALLLLLFPAAALGINDGSPLRSRRSLAAGFSDSLIVERVIRMLLASCLLPAPRLNMAGVSGRSGLNFGVDGTLELSPLVPLAGAIESRVDGPVPPRPVDCLPGRSGSTASGRGPSSGRGGPLKCHPV